MKDKFIVREDGIYLEMLNTDEDCHSSISILIIPKEIFIEAFNEYVKPTLISKEEINEWKRRLP